MIDVTQPIILHQEPSFHAEGVLRAHGGMLKYQIIQNVSHRVLCLPPASRVAEHLKYRGVIQYHISLPDAFVFTLCSNRDAETGEVYNVVVVPLG